MANTISKWDYSIPFATFLATSIGNGTFEDIVSKLKVDPPGEPAAATDIFTNSGQLLSNLLDDKLAEDYRIHEGNKLHAFNTTNATPANLTIETLANDGDAVYIRATVLAKSTTGELLEMQLGGTFYRAAGIVSVLNPISSPARLGFAVTVVAELVRSGNDILAQVTGAVAKTVAWDFTINESRRYR